MFSLVCRSLIFVYYSLCHSNLLWSDTLTPLSIFMKTFKVPLYVGSNPFVRSVIKPICPKTTNFEVFFYIFNIFFDMYLFKKGMANWFTNKLVQWQIAIRINCTRIKCIYFFLSVLSVVLAPTHTLIDHKPRWLTIQEGRILQQKLNETD